MYYRIQDETTKEYLPSVYNQESKTLIKTEIETFLEADLSLSDLRDLHSLKWDQYMSKLRGLGLIVEEQPTPFPAIKDNDNAWAEWVDEERWDEADRYDREDDNW